VTPSVTAPGDTNLNDATDKVRRLTNQQCSAVAKHWTISHVKTTLLAITPSA